MRLTATLDVSRYAYAERTARRILKPGATVIDIGAGDGPMRHPIERSGFNWLGFDLRPGAGVTYCDLNEPLPASAQADCVLLLDVIEHLTNPGLALTNIRAALRPGSALIVTTPNPRWSRSRLAALANGYPACFTQSDLDLNGHVFPVWPHVLERMLADNGFTVEEYVTLEGPARWPRAPYTIRYPFRCAVAAAMMAIERRDATARGMSFAVTAIVQ